MMTIYNRITDQENQVDEAFLWDICRITKNEFAKTGRFYILGYVVKEIKHKLAWKFLESVNDSFCNWRRQLYKKCFHGL